MTRPRVDCTISEGVIDPGSQRNQFSVGRHCGGYVSFEGIIRDNSHDKTVLRLEYEVYYELAASELTRICESARETFGLDNISVTHRVGSIEIGELAVMIQVSGKHRDECFLGCRQIIDELKVSVPIWKHEFYVDGTDDWTQCSHH
jgi:molybdopterin synthase catalytic subunit